MNRSRLETFSDAVIAIALKILVALMWLIPDQRIERKIGRGHRKTHCALA